MFVDNPTLNVLIWMLIAIFCIVLAIGIFLVYLIRKLFVGSPHAIPQSFPVFATKGDAGTAGTNGRTRERTAPSEPEPVIVKDTNYLLMEAYRFHLHGYELWKHRNPQEKITRADAQALLLKALGPLAEYVLWTGSQEALALLDAHLKCIWDYEMLASQYNMEPDRLR